VKEGRKMKTVEEIYAEIKAQYASGGEGSLAAVAQAVAASSGLQGGRMSDWFENRMIDHIFRGQVLTLPPALYIALYSTRVTEDSDAEELNGEGYARAVIPRSLSAWAGTQGPGSTEASSGASGLTCNNVPIQFPIAQGEWGTALWWAILDAPAGGNMLYYGELLYPRTVYPGDTPITFAPGDMTIWIDS
jgi:hypothetical protein